MGGDGTRELSRVRGCLLVVESACAQVLCCRPASLPRASTRYSPRQLGEGITGGVKELFWMLLRTVETNLSNFTDDRRGTDTRFKRSMAQTQLQRLTRDICTDISTEAW